MASKSKKSKVSTAAVNARRQAATAARLARAGVVSAGSAPQPGAAHQVSDDAAMAKLEAGRLMDAGYGRVEAKAAAQPEPFSVPAHRQVGGRDGLFLLIKDGSLAGPGDAGGQFGGRRLLSWERAQIREVTLLAYRTCCDASVPALGSALNPDKVAAAGCGGSGTSDVFVASLAMTGEMGKRRTAAEAAVLAAYPGGLEITALRRVAWAGETARSVARNGREADALVAALLRAADVLAGVLGVQGAELLAGS